MLNETTNITTTISEENAVLGLALVFCILLLFVGFREKGLWILAGPVWLFCGIQIFRPYNDFFMIMSIGIGMVLMIWGAYSVLD